MQETKPVFSKGAKTNPCSLLQIATRDAAGKEEVFVLDLLSMQPKVYNSALSDVFLSKSVVKLGQGFYQDLRELSESYPKATCFRVVKSVVEVNDLSVALIGGGGHYPLSLQKLVFLYLHRKLTKTQQTSNWNRRPLAASQLHYAAADALVLIHLFDELMQRIAQTQPDFAVDSVANVLDVHVPPSPKCKLCFSAFTTPGELKKHRKECTASIHTLEICTVCDEKKLITAQAMEQHVVECSNGSWTDDTPSVTVKVATKKQVVVAAGRKRSRSVTSVTDATESAPAVVKALAPTAKQTKAAADPTVTAKRSETTSATQVQRAQVADAIYLLQQQRKKQRKQRKQAKNAEAVEPVTKSKADTATTAASPVAESKVAAVASSTETKAKAKRKQQRKKVRAAEALLQEATAGVAATTLGQSTKSAKNTKSDKSTATPLKRRKMSVESSLLASDAIWSQVSSDNSSSMFSP